MNTPCPEIQRISKWSDCSDRKQLWKMLWEIGKSVFEFDWSIESTTSSKTGKFACMTHYDSKHLYLPSSKEDIGRKLEIIDGLIESMHNLSMESWRAGVLVKWCKSSNPRSSKFTGAINGEGTVHRIQSLEGINGEVFMMCQEFTGGINGEETCSELRRIYSVETSKGEAATLESASLWRRR